jgi:hypothetical protein
MTPSDIRKKEVSEQVERVVLTQNIFNMTAKEYQEMMGKKTVVMPVPSAVKGQPKRFTTADHLKMMGHFFELDEKKVKFYIRQLELSGKL